MIKISYLMKIIILKIIKIYGLKNLLHLLPILLKNMKWIEGESFTASFLSKSSVNLKRIEGGKFFWYQANSISLGTKLNKNRKEVLSRMEFI